MPDKMRNAVGGAEEPPVGEARKARVERETAETKVRVSLTLEGTGLHEISTDLGFFDHMLAQVAVHGLFDLEVQACGDLYIDPHHTVEDVALTLGHAFDQAVGDRAGLVRLGAAHVPMDESLAFVAVDLSGRAYAVTDVCWQGTTVGGLPVTLISHVFRSLSSAARASIHARVFYGQDDHHKAEALFKALGRALDAATRLDPRRMETIPSTKGSLT